MRARRTAAKPKARRARGSDARGSGLLRRRVPRGGLSLICASGIPVWLGADANSQDAGPSCLVSGVRRRHSQNRTVRRSCTRACRTAHRSRAIPGASTESAGATSRRGRLLRAPRRIGFRLRKLPAAGRLARRCTWRLTWTARMPATGPSRVQCTAGLPLECLKPSGDGGQRSASVDRGLRLESVNSDPFEGVVQPIGRPIGPRWPDWTGGPSSLG